MSYWPQNVVAAGLEPRVVVAAARVVVAGRAVVCPPPPLQDPWTHWEYQSLDLIAVSQDSAKLLGLCDVDWDLLDTAIARYARSRASIART